MDQLNRELFLLINAGADHSAIMVYLARLLAEDLIWIVPSGLTVGWLRGSQATRHALLEAILSGLAGLLINQLIGLVWYHPRPAELGIGLTLMDHVRDSSFPSDHLTLIWAVAFSLLMHNKLRTVGWVLALLGLPVAWARIYLGVHFPFDIVGSAVVALGCAWLIPGEMSPLLVQLMQGLQAIHRRMFNGLIKRGWVKK